MVVMKLPRWVHHLYAALAGYFWLPCPLCAVEFGGHEWHDDVLNGRPGSIPMPGRPGHAHLICPACTLAGRGYEVPARRYVS